MTQTKQPKTASKFTPGPLQAIEWEDGTIQVMTADEGAEERLVAEIPTSKHFNDPRLGEPLADARLYAAAPKMYEWLGALVHWWDDGCKPNKAIISVAEARRIKAAIDGEA